MVVDVHIGPCSDPGSTPGVSTLFRKIVESIILIILSFFFVWLLFKAKKTNRKSALQKRKMVKKIKGRWD